MRISNGRVKKEAMVCMHGKIRFIEHFLKTTGQASPVPGDKQATVKNFVIPSFPGCLMQISLVQISVVRCSII
jgi:hypothetical protein